MPLGLRRGGQHFDLSVQDMLFRITGPDDLYEEVRAAAFQCWEQIQSHSINNPAFRSSGRPIEVPAGAPAIVRRMAEVAAIAGVGPMFTVRGAMTEFIGRAIARGRSEVSVACDGDWFVIARRRSRIQVHRGGRAGSPGIAVVIRPELGPHGVYSTMGRRIPLAPAIDELVVVARSPILADAAAAGATSILSRPRTFWAALTYLRGLPGVHGAIVIRGARIGLAGTLELAA